MADPGVGAFGRSGWVERVAEQDEGGVGRVRFRGGETGDTPTERVPPTATSAADGTTRWKAGNASSALRLGRSMAVAVTPRARRPLTNGAMLADVPAGAVSEIAAKAHRDSVARAGYRGAVIEPRPRCAWAGADRPDPDVLMVAYHDGEWGRPCHDDTELFERLALESFQAGLSWSTILRKREAFRAAFRGFDPVSWPPSMGRPRAPDGRSRDRPQRRQDRCDRGQRGGVPGDRGGVRIVRRLSRGARATPAGAATIGRHRRLDPGSTPASDALSVDLKRRGFKFVGSTIVYAFMQSVGLVDDHLPECFLYQG
jgi:DNA-3-methyladenine glycosylase I